MSAAPGPSSRTPGFADPLGRRIITGDQATGLVETLLISPEIARTPAFEGAVRDGIARLGSFVNPFCGRVRRLDQADGPDAGLALVSDYVEGNRLSEILALAEQQQIQINTSATLDILSQLVAVIAALHDHAVGGFHGVLGPERIVVRPDTQIVVVEHVLGPAFRRLPHRSPEEHWRRFRLAVPADPTLPPFGPRTDLLQIGVVALSLVLGRQLRAGEYPGRVGELLTVATETDLVGRRRALGDELRAWIAGLLQLDPDRRLKSMAEANDGLDHVLADEDRYIAAPIALEALVRPRRRRGPGARRIAAEVVSGPTLEEPGLAALGELAAPAPATQILGAPDVRAGEDTASAAAVETEVDVGEIPAPRPASEVPEAGGLHAAEVSSDSGSIGFETAGVSTTPESADVVAPEVMAVGVPASEPVEAPVEAEAVPAVTASIQGEESLTDVEAGTTAAATEPVEIEAPLTDVAPDLVMPRAAAEPPVATEEMPEPPAEFTEEVPPSRFTPLFESNGVQTVADRLAAMPLSEVPEPPLISLGRELESSAAADHVPAVDMTARAPEPERPTPAPRAQSRPWPSLPVEPPRAQETAYAPVETVTLHEFFERTQHGGPPAVAPPRATPDAVPQATSAVWSAEPVVLQVTPASSKSAAGTDPRITRDAVAGPATTVALTSVSIEPVAAAVPADREPQVPPGRRLLVEADSTPPRRPLPGHVPADPAPHTRRWTAPLLAAAAILIVASVGLSVTVWRKAPPRAAEPATGVLSVTSRPPGAEVVVDGEPRGRTPLRLALATGRYRLEVRGAGEPKESTVEVRAGTEVLESFTLDESATPVGSLHVVTRPPGAQVSVDGTARGRTPVTVGDLEPGSHALEVTSQFGTVDRNVKVEAGKTLTVNVPIVGYARIQSPLDLEVLENGKMLGTRDGGPILLPPGLHNLALVNDAVAFRGSELVVIEAGQTTAVNVDLPDGIVNLNAIPWAEVWIDGEKVGETPIANLSMRLGPHEVVFRNPKFGEMRYNVTVSLAAPVRLSVDFAKK